MRKISGAPAAPEEITYSSIQQTNKRADRAADLQAGHHHHARRRTHSGRPEECVVDRRRAIEFFRDVQLGDHVLLTEPTLQIRTWAEVMWQARGAAGLKFVQHLIGAQCCTARSAATHGSRRRLAPRLAEPTSMPHDRRCQPRASATPGSPSSAASGSPVPACGRGRLMSGYLRQAEGCPYLRRAHRRHPRRRRPGLGDHPARRPPCLAGVLRLRQRATRTAPWLPSCRRRDSSSASAFSCCRA